MSVYKSLPDDMDFSTEFPTYILAFCPDTCSWFATNKRFFYYEYPMDFLNEAAAITYFKQNPNVFIDLEKEMLGYRPQFLDNKIFIENTKEFVLIEN